MIDPYDEDAETPDQTLDRLRKQGVIGSNPVQSRAKPAEIVPKLNLSELEPGKLPRLDVMATKGNNQIAAHIEVKLVSLIVSPLNRILYMEAACTSASTAHSLMGCLTDSFPGTITWTYLKPDLRRYDHGAATAVKPPELPHITDKRLELSGHNGIHHVAVLERAETLLFSDSDAVLWRKLRQRLTCPTLEGWGSGVMPRVHSSGLLLECEFFGLPEGLRPYVLAPDANDLFDKLVGEHVRSLGGLPAGAVK